MQRTIAKFLFKQHDELIYTFEVKKWGEVTVNCNDETPEGWELTLDMSEGDQFIVTLGIGKSVNLGGLVVKINRIIRKTN